MADYGAIADALAARFLTTTPPTGQPAIRLATSDLPNDVTALPMFLVNEPDDTWTTGTSGKRSGTLTYECDLILPQSDEPRTSRLMANWRTALLPRLDGYWSLGGGLNVWQAVVTKTASGKRTYGSGEYPAVRITVVCSVSEAVTP